MSALFLVLDMAGERVALPASRVESVVELEGLTPVPGTPPHIAGLAALRSRVLTVVDPHRVLGVEPPAREGACEAVVIEWDAHPYALLVDAVHDVVDAPGDVLPLKASLGRGWSRLSSGMVEVEGRVMLLVDVGAVLSGPEDAALKSLSTIPA